MRKLLLVYVLIVLFGIFAAATSWAQVTVEQAETAMHAAEQDKSKLPDAENILRQAVKENPDSYKANFYLSQVLQLTKKPDAEVVKKKAENIQSEQAKHKFLSFMLGLIFGACVIAGTFFGWNKYRARLEEEERRQELEKLSSVYSRKFVDAQRELQNIVIHLEMCDVKFNNKIYNDINELKSSICDIVERITEGHDWSKREAENLLEEVTNCINYCRTKFK